MAASPGVQGRLSPHFVAAEFRCPHCHAAVVRKELVTLLERIRRIVGGPLPIVSGYRCPEHNARVGGAANSMHMYGAAADLPYGLVTQSTAMRAMAVGIGTKGDYAVHVDVRDGAPARWTY
jgi:uncharacterized protein YcbK (DUF882 family)